MQKQPDDLMLGYSVVHAAGCCFASVTGKNTALETVAILTDFPLLSTAAALHICLRFLDRSSCRDAKAGRTQWPLRAHG